MTTWYYSDAQRAQHGPVTADELAALHGRGRLPPDALVWREGMAGWRPWREMMVEVIGGSPAGLPASVAPATACEGHQNPTSRFSRQHWMSESVIAVWISANSACCASRFSCVSPGGCIHISLLRRCPMQRVPRP